MHKNHQENIGHQAIRGDQESQGIEEKVFQSSDKLTSPGKVSKPPPKVSFVMDDMGRSSGVNSDHQVQPENSVVHLPPSSEEIQSSQEVLMTSEEVHVSTVEGVQVFEEEIQVCIPDSEEQEQEQETSILPDQLSLAYEECIEETITTSQESSDLGRTNIIVRNETGFSEEKMKNVLVLHGAGGDQQLGVDGGVQTSTIHIQVRLQFDR